MNPTLTHYEPNRLTGYEVVFQTVKGETYRLGFTVRRSFHGLLHVAQQWTPEQWAAMGVTETTKSMGQRGRNACLTLLGVGVIRFTGETKHSIWSAQQR